MDNKLSSEAIASYINKNCTFEISVLETVDSTNAYCRRIAADNSIAHQTVVVANKQTSGRGRLGRDFFSPEDTGVYMSIILQPDLIKLSPPLLTIAAGVAVCRVLNSAQSDKADIKWVNDIFINGKKVCGILAEGILDPQNNKHKYIIVGIGINLFTPAAAFDDKLSGIAGSVFPQNASRNEIIAKVLDELSYIYMKASSQDLIDEYKSYSLVLGKKIEFSQNGIAYTGIASDINIDGNLVVILENGNSLTLKSGEVSLGSHNFT